MTTVAALVEITRNRYINAGHREERNRLAAGITDSDESLTIEFDAGGLARGSRLSVGLEDMYVWSVQGSTVNVDRGQFGTTPAAHDQGDIVHVNARPSTADVVAAFNETITTLTNRGLFRVRHVDITGQPTTPAYDLPTTGYIAPIDVRWKDDAGDEDWPILRSWSVADSVATSGFASGRALRVMDVVRSGATIRFRYRAELSAALDALDDVVEDVTGLPAYATHLLPLGAALRLVAGREVARSRDDRQGDTRRAEEVPPNANLLSARGIQSMFDAEVQATLDRLNLEHPVRYRTGL